MILHLMSDVHLEHHQDGGRAFLGGLCHPEADVLALAGDITNYGDLSWQAPLFRRAYPNARILYVKGNHEFYGGQVETALRCFDRVAKANPFVTFLEPGVEVTVEGHRFIGATMWFRDWRQVYEPGLNDFTCIRTRALGGFRAWVKHKNQEWVDFYEANGKPGDVVVTHHIPSWGALDPQFAGDPLNQFYVYDMTELIERIKPKLWLHGHCHLSLDTVIGDTRFVRNPLGYPHQAAAYWRPKEIVL